MAQLFAAWLEGGRYCVQVVHTIMLSGQVNGINLFRNLVLNILDWGGTFGKDQERFGCHPRRRLESGSTTDEDQSEQEASGLVTPNWRRSQQQ